MAGFKDMVERDLSAMFLDVDFFGETYRIEGIEIPIVMDNDELKVRQGGQDLRWLRVPPFFMPALRIFRPAVLPAKA